MANEVTFETRAGFRRSDSGDVYCQLLDFTQKPCIWLLSPEGRAYPGAPAALVKLARIWDDENPMKGGRHE